jgi:poly(glycerol-phosphate) alpha-glucosyltransferase
MKAILIMDSVSRSGGGLLDAERCLHQGMEELGISTSVFALEDTYTAADLPAWSPLRPRVFPHSGPVALGASPVLQRAVSGAAADLIYRAGLWRFPSKYAHEWSRKHRKPEIIAPHGMLDPWAVRNSQWKKRLAHLWFEGAHLRDASCIRALCQSEADSIRAYGLKNPLCVIPNGVELVQIGDRRSEIGEPRKILLFLGRLHPKKGLPNALRAWKQALHSTSNIQHSKFDEWQFVVAGWDQGGHEADLKRLCDELELKWADVPAAEFVGGGEEFSVVGCPLSEALDVGASRSPNSPQMPRSRVEQSATSAIDRQQTTDNSATVVFTGPAFGDTKDALLRRAHAFILPSFSEGLPMSVLEAWSYGLPVLMTDHCNLPEGFTADAALRIGTDVENIAEGLLSLLASRVSDLAAMGGRGRQLVSERFTWPQVAAQMKEVYEWVLGGGEVPACVRQC